MKKLIICLALASIVVSCKKIQAGGNKSVIKLEEGADRYSEDAQGEGGHDHAVSHKEENTTEIHEGEAHNADSTAVAKPAESKLPAKEH